MRTIKVRAQEYVFKNFHRIAEDLPIQEGMETVFYESAREQRAIDIEQFAKYAEAFNKQNERLGIETRIDVESMRLWARNIILGVEIDTYIGSKIMQATPTWNGVDVDAFMKDFRGIDPDNNN